MTTLKENLQTLKTCYNGYRAFKATGQTPHEAYVAMRKLFVETNGWFNDVFQFFYGLNKPYRPFLNMERSVFKGVTIDDIKHAAASMRHDGYYIFPQRLGDEYIDRLREFALTTPCVLQYDQAGAKQQQTRVVSEAPQQKTNDLSNNETDYFKMGHVVRTKDVFFDPDHLVATNYRFAEESVLSYPIAQTLMADPLIINLAQQYIRSRVMFAFAAMWWTTPYGCEKPSSALAQMYHFDMDRIKFITFFLYLTDVGPGDGPHCYVKGSCRRKPKALRRDGRFTDSEIEAVYESSRIKEFTAPRGTLFAVDGRGFHKAKMPVSGNRLVLEFELTSSMFGVAYPRSSFEVKSPELEWAIKEDPFLWSNFNVTYKGAREAALVR